MTSESESDDSYDESGSEGEQEVVVKRAPVVSSGPDESVARVAETATTPITPADAPSAEPAPTPVTESSSAPSKSPRELTESETLCSGCGRPPLKGAPVMTLPDQPGKSYCSQKCIPLDERSRKLTAESAERPARGKSPGFLERHRQRKEKKAHEKEAAKAAKAAKKK